MIYIIEAIRTIYPAIQGGFAYWKTKDDGTPWDHPVDGLVWENEEFEKPNWDQIETVLSSIELKKFKETKISEIKKIRDQKNIEPITDFEGFLLDEEGNKTTQQSYFVFYANRHQTNPASDPEAIISRAINLGAMPYFTKDLEDRKITVELTAEIAGSLRQRIADKNDGNYKISKAMEAAISNAQTIEEVEEISNQILNQ